MCSAAYFKTRMNWVKKTMCAVGTNFSSNLLDLYELPRSIGSLRSEIGGNIKGNLVKNITVETHNRNVLTVAACPKLRRFSVKTNRLKVI